MGKSIDERSHEAIRAYLRHRGIEVLEEGWARGSGSIDPIAMDDEELVFVDAATKCGGHDMPREEPDQGRFERIAAAYLAEAEVEGLTSIRYDIVSLLVTGSEKALLRHHKNVLSDGR
ncbi:YraN family protein [uncultured Olsenella sp.]|uniref:YraN family protein n=1 Tax=uncultured Olsenella sp. TaxID=190764 RepID=UPI0026DD4920|nr:YraN family protein [uncultured Olsenella sp.]